MRSFLPITLAVTLLLSASCTPRAEPTPPDASHPVQPDAGGVDAPPSRPDANIPDAIVPDANPCSPLTYCGDGCFDLDTDPRNCGLCERVCSAPDNATAYCAAGACGFRCQTGFALQDGACAPAPRLLWPPSLSTVNTRRPPFRWVRPAGATGADLQICRDRGCLDPVLTTSVGGNMARPLARLPEGWLYWRVLTDDVSSPTWAFRVRRSAATHETASGLRPDYDGDGLGDLAIGAPETGAEEGRAYIHYGHADGPPAGADQILYNPDGTMASFGLSVSCVGDINGDGYADLAVSSPHAYSNRGRVHLYLGHARGLRSSPDISIDGRAEGSLFGFSVVGAGDVNGDGYADLLVSAPGAAGRTGEVLLFRGAATGLTTPASRIIVGEARFGISLAAAGDVNGDGYGDVMIGSPFQDENRGSAQLHFGSSGGISETASQIIEGMGEQLGLAMAGLGDVNADGFSDVAVSAPASNMAQGQVLIFHGSRTGLTPAPATTLIGNNTGGGFFGHALAALGDANGDGRDDLAVGSFAVAESAGRVTIFVSDTMGIRSLAVARLEGPAGAGSQFGWSLAALSDADEDTLDDLAVGAPGAVDEAGRVYVFRGDDTEGIFHLPLRSLTNAAGGALGRSLGRSDR